MDETPNRIQEQRGEVTNRKATQPEGQGPLQEGLTSATLRPANSPEIPTGSEVNGGWARRDSIWSDVHDPIDTDTDEVDARAGGDPNGHKPA